MSYVNKLGQGGAKRKRVLTNLVADVIRYEKIITSLPRAKSLTKLLAKLITWTKKDTLHSRRMALRFLVNKKHLGVVNKLFTDLKIRYQERAGGYSRITKFNLRPGDNSLRVIFSLV